MAINHTNCGVASRRFCDELFDAIRSIEPSGARHESTTCGFTVGASNRFAYLYHKLESPLATIFLRGDDPTQIPPLSNGVSPELRENRTGHWAVEFPQSIHLPNGSSPLEMANLLIDYSLPLATKKTGRKAARESINSERLVDGIAKTTLVTTYERNRTLRAICWTNMDTDALVVTS